MTTEFADPTTLAAWDPERRRRYRAYLNEGIDAHEGALERFVDALTALDEAEPNVADDPAYGGLGAPTLRDRVFAVVRGSPRVALKSAEIHDRLLAAGGEAYLEEMRRASGDPIRDALRELVGDGLIERCGRSSATCYRETL